MTFHKLRRRHWSRKQESRSEEEIVEQGQSVTEAQGVQDEHSTNSPHHEALFAGKDCFHRERSPE